MNNGVKRKLNFNAVANAPPIQQRRNPAKKKEDYIRQYANGLRKLRNGNQKNHVNRGRKMVLNRIKNIGFNTVLTPKSQDDLVNVYMVGIKLNGKTDNMINKLWNHAMKRDHLTNIREIIRNDKTIKKDKDATLGDLSWLMHKLLVAKIKSFKVTEVEAAKAKRNKAATKLRNNLIAKLTNNNAAKFKNIGNSLLKSQNELVALKKRITSEKGKLDRIRKAMGSMNQKKGNNGFTNKEQQKYNKLTEDEKTTSNLLTKSSRKRVNKSVEVDELKKAKENILQNVKANKKEIDNAAKGIAKGAIQKAIAANKARIKREKENAMDAKFLINLDAKVVANMKKQSNVDMKLKKLDEEIDEMTIGKQNMMKEHEKKKIEKTKFQQRLTKIFGGDYYDILKKSNKETDKILLDALNDLSERVNTLNREDGIYIGRITKAKKERKAIVKQRKIAPTKMFYLYQIRKLLKNEGLYSQDIMLKLKDFPVYHLKQYYLDFTILVDLQYLNIPEFKNRVKNVMNKPTDSDDLFIYRFTETPENKVRILASKILSDKAKSYALSASTYDVYRKGDVKQIMDLKISPYWKGRLLLKAQAWSDFLNLDDLNLITQNVLNKSKKLRDVIGYARERLDKEVIRDKAIAKLKPGIMSFKTKLNKKKVAKGVGNLVPNVALNRIINNMNKTITKKVKDTTTLRTNVSKLSKSKSPRKLTLMTKELTRRNKEIQTLVKEYNTIKKFKSNKPTRRTAASKITKSAKVYFFKKGMKNAKMKRDMVSKFINTVIARDTRPTLKQKYRVFTRLMKPDSELNFLAETGNARGLANALGERRLVCHVANKNEKYVRTYIPSLRESLYTLSSQYFDQEKKANNKSKYRKDFLDRFHSASAFPCLEGTFTALTESIIDPGFEWDGYIGMRKDKRGPVPLDFRDKEHIEYFRDTLIGKSMGLYYKTLSKKLQEDYRNASINKKLNIMWNKFKTLQISHGVYLTPMGEIEENDKIPVRKTFVDAFKMYSDYIYNNNKNYTPNQLTNMNKQMENLNYTNLINN